MIEIGKPKEQIIKQRDFDKLIGPIKNMNIKKTFNGGLILLSLGAASLGLAKDAQLSNDKLILDAQLSVDGAAGNYPEFKGNVSTVYTHPLTQGGASNSHYNGNAQTYMDVGLAMGEAMVRLLEEIDE